MLASPMLERNRSQNELERTTSYGSSVGFGVYSYSQVGRHQAYGEAELAKYEVDSDGSRSDDGNPSIYARSNTTRLDGSQIWAVPENGGGDDCSLSYNERFFVFVCFSLGVQMFMSFSGGATPASLPAIVAANPGLSQFEQSLLGSLDKVGCVVASVFWGWALQRFPTKLTLAVGLFLCAGFSLQFGFLQSKYSMFFAKFMQGCTESQQIVWGNLWTASRAPESDLSLWMNLGGVAAGVGTALGTAVAGFGIACDLPYCFAYAVQTAVLLTFWVGLLFVPARFVALGPGIKASQELEELTTSETASNVSQKQPSLLSQLRALRTRRLYWYTMLAIAEMNFVTSGLQFFWTRFFYQGPWSLDMSFVTASNLLVNGLGMGLGIFLGPMLMNAYGGYGDDLGRYVTLCLLLRITAVAVFGAGFAILAVAMQLTQFAEWGDGGGLLDSSLFNPWLWVFWAATIPINFALAAQGGVQMVINIASAPKDIQEFAQGVTTSVQNLCGYAGGVIIPSLVLDVAYHVSLATAGYAMTEADQLAVGVALVCATMYALLATVSVSAGVARERWEKKLAQGRWL